MASVEERLALLEQRYQQLSDQVQMESGLAAARDRDLSALTVTVKLHTAMLQAVQEKQAEHSERFDRIEATLDAHGRALEAHSQEFAEVRAGIQTLVGMLTTLIEQDKPSKQ